VIVGDRDSLSLGVHLKISIATWNISCKKV